MYQFSGEHYNTQNNLIPVEWCTLYCLISFYLFYCDQQNCFLISRVKFNLVKKRRFDCMQSVSINDKCLFRIRALSIDVWFAIERIQNECVSHTHWNINTIWATVRLCQQSRGNPEWKREKFNREICWMCISACVARVCAWKHREKWFEVWLYTYTNSLLYKQIQIYSSISRLSSHCITTYNFLRTQT